MTTKNIAFRTRRRLNMAGLILLALVMSLAGCGGGGGGGGDGGSTPPPPAPPPAARTFHASLDMVVVIDRGDGSSVLVDGDSVSGATATLP